MKKYNKILVTIPSFVRDITGYLVRQLVTLKQFYSMKGTLIISRDSFWNSPWPRKIVYISTGFTRAASTYNSYTIAYVCVRTFATWYFANQSADHMVQFPRISLARSLFPALFGPGFFLRRSSSPTPPLPVLFTLSIFISLTFVADPVPSFLARRPNPDQRILHEALAHWGRSFRVTSMATVGSLVLTGPQSLNTNARLLRTLCLLFTVMEKDVSARLIFSCKYEF